MASLMLGALPVPSQSLNLSSRVSFSRTETLSVALSTPIPVSASPQTLPLVYCGRGDKKTAKGKRFNHSYGNARPRNKKKGRGPPRVTSPPSPRKKDRFDDDEMNISVAMKKKMSVIQKEDDKEGLCIISTKMPRESIRQVIPKKISLYSSLSSSSSCHTASRSPHSSPRKSSRSLEMMKGRNKSLRSLLEMERTSSDGGIHGQTTTKPFQTITDRECDGLNRITSGSSLMEVKSGSSNRRMKSKRLRRIKSFRTLPGLRLRRRKHFIFIFRLRSFLRIMICGRKS